MVRRNKNTAKTRAQRIDLEYFKRINAFRGVRLAVSGAAVLAAVVWIVWALVKRDATPYSMGQLASVHASFGEQCALCHANDASYREHVADKPCLRCHDGPEHSIKKTFSPACGSCHVDHRGNVDLAMIPDQMCTQCHASLEVKRAFKPAVEKTVTSFATHPEFGPLRKEGADTGTIRLNHEVHLKSDLRGPGGPVQLACNDCHRPMTVSEEWRFGEERYRALEVSLVAPDPLAPKPTGLYMGRVEYAKACAACHLLEFDERLPDQVPHEKTEVVDKFVKEKFREYIASHPEELAVRQDGERRLPGFLRPPSATDARALTPDEWVERRVEETELRLWSVACRSCHQIDRREGALPAIARPAIPAPWLPHGKFDHEPHSMLECGSCHQAGASRETADVILPSVKVCQDCHHEGGAEARCFECHDYHDWSQKNRVKGQFKVPDLVRDRGGARGGKSAAPVKASSAPPASGDRG